MEPLPTLGIGIIGLGLHGLRYAEHLLAGEVPGAHLAAVCRRGDEGRSWAAERGLAFHPNAPALVADPAVDAVVIASSTDHHLPAARAVAGAGKPMLVEKPLARSHQEASAFREIAGRIPVMVAHTTRYNPVILGARREFSVARPFSVWISICQGPLVRTWGDTIDRAGGGVILDSGVHLFDAARFLLGSEVARVSAFAASRAGHLLEDHFAAILEMETGEFVNVGATKAAGARMIRFGAAGKDGLLLGDLRAGSLKRIGPEGEADLDLSGWDLKGVRPVLTDFARFARGEIANPIPVAEGIASIRVAEACYASVQTGRAEKVGE